MVGSERVAQLERIMDLLGFPKSAGMRLVSAEPGRVTMALAKRPDLTQFFGHFHGGVVAGLADHAAGACATSSMPDGKLAVTIEIKVNFLSPADGEEIIARAETIQAGSTIVVVKVEVISQKAGAERVCAFAAEVAFGNGRPAHL